MKLSDLKDKMTDFKTRLPNVKNKFSNLKIKLSSLKSKLSDVKIKLSNFKNKLPNLKSVLFNLKSKLSIIKTKFSDFKNKLPNLKSVLSNLKSKLSIIKTKFSNIKSKLPTFNISDLKRREILMSIMCSLVLVCFCATLFASFKQQIYNYLQPVSVQAEEQINEQDVAGEEINIEDLENSNDETPSENTSEDVVATVSQPVNNTTGNSVPSSTNFSGKKYYIKVNYGANVVTIYTSDTDGYYTIPIKAMVCSTGRATPRSGTYRIQSRWEWLGLIGRVYGHYSTQITGNILFHSVPYLEKYNPASLEYWEYDKLGTTASAGCIRLTIADAKWIYNNIPRGTPVEFYSSADPGPLGKPSAQKISGNEACRNWDPTDSDPNNPWHAYNASTVTPPSPPPSQNNNTVTTPPASDNTNITVPDNNSPADNNNTSENTIPDNTIPDNTVPDDNTSNNTIPSNTLPDTTPDSDISENSTPNNINNSLPNNE